MSDHEPWRGIPSDRVVAVVASLDNGRTQVGSGYLLNDKTVITAQHCTVDKKTGRSAVALQIIRLSDGFRSNTEVIATSLDIAVLGMHRTLAAAPRLPLFGRVDTTHSAELSDCEAVGFPIWQLDPRHHQRNAAEIHGTIRTTEGAEDGVLVLRDPLLSDVKVPEGVSGEDRASRSWGGLSGALVFHAGVALGVITEHYPRQGGSALTLLPVQRMVELSRKGDPDAAKVAAALGLPATGDLPVAGAAGVGIADLRRVIVGVVASDDHDGRLAWIVVNTLRAAGIGPEHCERQDEADGSHLITLPTGIDPAFTLLTVLRAARLAVDQANTGTTGRKIRILLAAAYGAVQLAANGYVGPGITDARTMLAADVMCQSLRESRGADLVAAVSDHLYLDLCSRNPGDFKPSRFRAITLAVPGTPYVTQCWVYATDGPLGAQLAGALIGAPATTAHSMTLDAIPLAGIGTAIWWSRSGHDHPHSHTPSDDHGHGSSEVYESHGDVTDGTTDQHDTPDLDGSAYLGHHDLLWVNDVDHGITGSDSHAWNDLQYNDFSAGDYNPGVDNPSDVSDIGNSGYSGDVNGW